MGDRPAAARTARLRLVKGGRTFATGTTVLASGRTRVRLKRTRMVRPGSYRLQVRVAGEAISIKVRLRPSGNRVRL